MRHADVGEAMRPPAPVYGEKSLNCLAQRNGWRERDWETRAGTVELRIPKLKKGACFPGVP